MMSGEELMRGREGMMLDGDMMVAYVYNIFIVSDEQVPEDSSLVEISQRNHVFDSVNGCWMHRFNPPLCR